MDERHQQYHNEACEIAKTIVAALQADPETTVAETVDKLTGNSAHGNRVYLRSNTGVSYNFVIKTAGSLERSKD